MSAELPERVAHEMTVEQLDDCLLELQDEDLLVPNQLGNLAIVRRGRIMGVIDFSITEQRVEWYDDPPGSMDA